MAYIAPSTRSAGALITAAIWNQDVVANPIALYAGAMSIASQAIGDLVYATSTTQLGRLADVAVGAVLVSGGVGVAPAWSTAPTLTGQWNFSAAVPIVFSFAGTSELVGSAGTLRLSSNNSLEFQVDRNNDGAETFKFMNGAAAVVAEITEAGAVDFASSITAGSGNVTIVDGTGKIPSFTSTYFASLDGAAITGSLLSLTAITTTGDVTVGDQLIVSGVGPHAVGTTTNLGRQFVIGGTFSPSGAVADGSALSIVSRINAEVGIDAMGLFVQPRLAEAASGTHNLFASMQVLAYDQTLGGATVTNGVALYINSAPTNAVNNYAVWVDSGTVRIDGDVTIGAGLQVLTGGDLDVVDYLKLTTGSNTNYNGASAPTSWHGTPATAGLGQPPVWFRVKNRATGTEYRVPGYSEF